MILLNGISGFNVSDDKTVDGVQFKSLCKSIVLNLGGSVLSFKDPKVAQNYYYAEIEISDEKLYILINGHYPFIAFASSGIPGDITFVDNEQLAKCFEQYYRILYSYELEEPLRVKQPKGNILIGIENELNGAELVNVKHWQPKRVGDIVFNYWD
ncbi:hypothetical protein [Alkalihalobacillus sp. LMS39]|uniref:hypothetical protein n=1 Tax=Alkalihalobacillus sp. LMS39 TaxID=2924032 RepID=UPI001FB366CE|nr:hypothetical protein [Alkalihalobacillus sp. LMS39]UOE95243.1 hypothetical protein MM271_06375 [Alkalihalobacillus sp. LMS39]